MLTGPWMTAISTNGQFETGRFADTTDWKSVELPHDWSVQHNFDSIANAGNDGGYLPGIAATYRYTLPLDTILPGTYSIYIEGAYMNPTVWVNGEEVDSHFYGYSPFRVDISDYLESGDNSLAITVDNTTQKNCRWYSGTGLYRPVWLEYRDPLHIEPWSMVVTTPGIRPGMGIGRMEATLLDSRERTATATLTATLEITDPTGTPLSPENKVVTLNPDQHANNLQIDFPIPDPLLWSPETPQLYTATLTVTDATTGEVARESVTFGVRSFDFDAEEGAFLNDKPITINGACVHHDNGILGAAAYSAADWNRVKMLKEAGFNAVRTSHNVPSESFLDACDRLGLLVIDEAFDGWAEKKNTHDYGEVFNEQWPDDLALMIKRDRNHPSIICWSIGNEILERKSPYAVTTAGEMARLCRSLDPTRPVTQALAAWDADWEIYDPLAAQHDIVGYNYMIHKAEGDHERVPERVMWQTESYPRDAFSNYLMVRDHPYVIGDFVWTGIDYIGESGIGRHYYEGEVPGEHYERPLWPWHNSQCGDIDITGHRKPISYYRDMLHNNRDMAYIAVREPNGYRGEIRQTLWGTYPAYHHWNWPGHEGKDIEVEVYTLHPQVALYLDNKKVATSPSNEKNGYIAKFTLPYRPGTLRAVALDSRGKEMASDTIVSAGTPSSISIDYERIPSAYNDTDLIFIEASLTDSDGNVNPTADNLVSFSINTEGTILGTGTADPTDPIGYTVAMRPAFNGRVQAIVKAPRASAPTITVNATGLPTAVKVLGIRNEEL